MKSFTQFWADERGFVVSSELVLIATIAVIGLLAGLTTLRDQVALEMGDVAQAISFANQSFSFSGVTSHTGSSAGTRFGDARDFCSGVRKDDFGNVIGVVNTVTPGVAVVAGE